MFHSVSRSNQTHAEKDKLCYPGGRSQAVNPTVKVFNTHILVFLRWGCMRYLSVGWSEETSVRSASWRSHSSVQTPADLRSRCHSPNPLPPLRTSSHRNRCDSLRAVAEQGNLRCATLRLLSHFSHRKPPLLFNDRRAERLHQLKVTSTLCFHACARARETVPCRRHVLQPGKEGSVSLMRTNWSLKRACSAGLKLLYKENDSIALYCFSRECLANS